MDFSESLLTIALTRLDSAMVVMKQQVRMVISAMVVRRP